METEQRTAGIETEPRRPVFGRAMCAIDGKEGGYAAVRQAASLMAPGSELTLLIVTSFRSAGERRPPAIGPLEADAIVKRAEGIAREAGVEPRVEVEPATPPGRVVLEWAGGYDLLAMGAPSASWLGGLLVAGVADSALGELRTPLLTVHGEAGASVREHVLLASDGHEDSAAPLALAGEIARAGSSRMTLLHAQGHLRRVDHRKLEAQTEELRAFGVDEPDLMLRHGRPHEVIVELAERLAASLVVVGSRRLAGPRALGSVSRRVVHEAGCSVLTVPPEWTAPPDETALAPT
jgi:nucleotide-binding universal stress UspA family protein